MAVVYESGNIGDQSNASSSTTLSISLAGTLTSSDVFIAILTGWSTSSDFTALSQTNVTWAYVSDFVFSADNAEVELWIGFATGTPGTTLTCTNNVSCYLTGYVQRWQGIPNQPVMLRAQYTGSGNLPGTFPQNTNQTVVTGINVNAGDALVGCFWWNTSAIMSSNLSATGFGTYYSQTFTAWSPAQTNMGWCACPVNTNETGLSARIEDINGALSGQAYFGIIFIIKGNLGGNLWTKSLSDPFSLVETIGKGTSRTNSDQLTITENFVQHRGQPPVNVADTFTLADSGILRAFGKNPKDPFTVTESFLATQTINAKTFLDPYSLTERISKATSRSTVLDAFAMVESYTSSLNAPAVGTITVLTTLTISDGSASGAGFTIPAMSAGQTLIIMVATNSAHSFASISCTNVTFYAGPSYFPSGGYQVFFYAGQATGTTGTSVSFTFSSAINYLIGYFIVSGAAAGNPFDSVSSTNYNSSAVGTGFVTASAPTNSNELELFCVSTASSLTTATLPFGNGGHASFNARSTESGGIFDYNVNVGNPGVHVDTTNFSPTATYTAMVCYVMPTITPFSVPMTLSDQFTVAEQVSKQTARVLATEAGIHSVFADVFVEHRMRGAGTLTDSFTSTFAEVFFKNPGKLPKDLFSLIESFTTSHTYVPGIYSDTFTLSDASQKALARGAVSDVVLLAETLSTSRGHEPVALIDTLPVLDSTGTLLTHWQAVLDSLSVSDISSLSYQQQQAWTDSITLSEIFGASHEQFASLADVITLLHALSAVHTYRESFLDVITILEAFLKTSTGSGALLVYATGSLLGSSTASAFVAAWVYAAATGHGYAAARISISFLVAALLKGASLLAGLAGQEFTDTGAASGASSVTGIEGARLKVATGSTEGDGSIRSDTSLWTAPTGEADGASPEMDCDTQCIFSADGKTMPNTPGSAVAVATYALLHLIATLRGASLAAAQVYSPKVASGDCKGESTAEYLSIALYDAETVGGESEALGMAGGLFHAVGECNPTMASNARGTANYGPGQIGALVRGRGVLAGTPTLLAV
jgi:hypothetical protein